MTPTQNPVRPTIAVLAELGIPMPPRSKRISDLDHPLIKKAQKTPELFAASNAKRIGGVLDRVWFKVKVDRCRGAVTNLLSGDLAGWWLCATGNREEGSSKDFYAALVADVGAHGGNSDYLLPTEKDQDRLRVENAVRFLRQLRIDVERCIAKSLLSEDVHGIEIQIPGNPRLGFQVRCDTGTSRVYCVFERLVNAQLWAQVMSWVPGIDKNDWGAEPHDSDSAIQVQPGQIVYSATMPPEAAREILEKFPDLRR